MWLGSKAISFICRGGGRWRRGRPCLSWDWAIFIRKGEPEEKFRRHAKNSRALSSVLIALASLFFLPGLSLPRTQIYIKISTREDIIVKAVVDGMKVDFMCQLDWDRGDQVSGQTLL